VLLRVPFADVDMHRHVHNGRYFSYAESAINEFIRLNDLSTMFDATHNDVAYYVKKVEIRYDGTAGFDDVLDVIARVARIGSTSLTFVARVSHSDGGSLIAEAEVVWVCVDSATGTPVPIPEPTRQALAAVDG
jgi:acyl-CoA thioester hydrolase